MEIAGEFRTLAIMVIGGIALLYLGGPILIYATARHDAAPRLVTFGFGERQIPVAVDDFFRRVVILLEPEGFEVVQGLYLPNQVANVKAMFLMLVNRAAGDSALASAFYGKNAHGGMKLVTSYVEFTTRFRDGTVLDTNDNAFMAGARRTREKMVTYRFPQVRDPARLYQVHQALVRRDAPASQKVLRLDSEFHGDAAAYLAAVIVEDYQLQVKEGWMQLAEHGTKYRMTLWGAYILCWKELWPIKPLMKAKAKRESTQLLAELGV